MRGQNRMSLMANYKLMKCTAEQLLDASANVDELIYEDDVLTLADGKLFKQNYQISSSQAQAVMRRILEDNVIVTAIRKSIARAEQNPLGNMPVEGAHPVDPAVPLVEERAIRPVLGELPPVTSSFMRMTYDYVKARN